MFTEEQVKTIAFEAAGAATAPLMSDHPDYIFPSERVKAAVERVLADHGIAPDQPAPSFSDQTMQPAIDNATQQMAEQQAARTGQTIDKEIH